MHVIEFPFNKIVRLYSTAYYRLKNPLQILVWGCRLFKGVLKILENVQVLYQESIHAVLIMSVLRKMTEFYKGESDREVIVIAAGGLGEGAASLHQQAGFPIMGPFPPTKFFPLPMKVLVPPIVT